MIVDGIEYTPASPDGNTDVVKVHNRSLEVIDVPWIVFDDANHQNACPTGLLKRSFAQLPHLRQVRLPDTILRIGAGAFCDCDWLESVKSGICLKEIGEDSFNGCVSLKVYCVPHYVKRIEAHTFCNCASLRYVALPDGLQYIGAYSFCNCESLEEMVLPGEVTDVMRDAFCGCTGLRKLVICNRDLEVNRAYWGLGDWTKIEYKPSTRGKRVFQI